MARSTMSVLTVVRRFALVRALRGGRGLIALALTGVALTSAVACSSGSSGQAEAVGPAGHPCYPNGTCNSGLTCSSGTCVVGGLESDGGLLAVASDASSEAAAEAGSPEAGTPGTTCTTDADCNAGRCIDNYCSPQCTVPSDCKVFFKSGGGFHIPLPTNLQGTNNVWNAAYLTNGATCQPAPASAGGNDGNSYCQFDCPAHAADVLSNTNCDANGGPCDITGCACLPNFVNKQNTCVWDSTVQCSPFKPCQTPANTTGPCAQSASCIMDKNLNGMCFSSTSNLVACAQANSSTCNPTCLANNCSGGTTDSCLQLCCK